MKTQTATLAVLFVLLSFPAGTDAQAPATMSFQGRLDFLGSPADTTLSLIFRLVDAATGTPTTVWTETQPAVVVENGVFSTLLGSITPLPSLEFAKSLWLEIEDPASGDTFHPLTPLSASPYALGLVLPQIHDVDPGGTAFWINNIGAGDGIKGETQGTTGKGLYGQASAFVGQNIGVYGFSASNEGTGVYGLANTVLATGANYGVYGKSNSNSGFGVYGTAPKRGVYGTATVDAFDSYGVYGMTAGSGLAVYGLSTGSGRGVYGHNAGTGRAGHFEINNTGNASAALFAFTDGTGDAGYFQISNASSSAHALNATTNGNGYGLNASGGPFGVRSTATDAFGIGVSGETATTTGIGVRGYATAGTGTTFGVLGQSSSTSGQGVRGIGNKYGVYAEATADGVSNDETAGIYAKGFDTFGGSFAGFFDGDVRVDHDLTVGNFTHIIGNLLAGEDLTVNGDADIIGNLDVSGGTKNFKIDHPLDPANKYLRHFSIESSEVLNIYSGNVTTDPGGFATVTLPDWFHAVNKDFRYQLTVIGSFARAIVAEEIEDGRFVIQTDKPGVKVSWQVTGIRNDPVIRANPPVVEEDKPTEERGTYLNPELYSGTDY